MRLYLSSYRFGHRAGVLARLGGRAAIVTNALDPYPDRLLNWDREVDDLARLGYASAELDLRQFWAAPGDLPGWLSEVDLLWVMGGNAFVLARAATAAGLGDALLRSPHTTYAGYSAGACLASVDLHGIDAMDDPDALPDGYTADMPARTLALRDTRVVPHAGSPEAIDAERELRAASLDYIALADGDDEVIGF